MPRDQLHLFAKTIQFADSCVNIRRDAKALEFFVDDGRDEDVVAFQFICRRRQPTRRRRDS